MSEGEHPTGRANTRQEGRIQGSPLRGPEQIVWKRDVGREPCIHPPYFLPFSSYPIPTPQRPIRVSPGTNVAKPHSAWFNASAPQVIGSMASDLRR